MFHPLIRAGAAFSLMLLPLVADAQDAAPVAAPTAAAPIATVDADPALWVVKDDDTTIYLFGTVHALKPGLGWFDDGIRAAFDKSDQLVLELVLPDPQQVQALVLKSALNPTGPTLTDRLPEQDRTAYNAALTTVGLPAGALDRFDPWFAAITLTQLSISKVGYDASSGVEMALTAAAKAEGKPVIGLESAEEQFGFLDGLSEPAQIAMLTQTVDELPKTTETLDRMVSQWAAGKPKELAATLNDSTRDTPDLAKVLLTDRNVRWAKWIDQRLEQPGTIFIAVGAGHLAGKDSVQDQLKAYHIRAKRVRY